MLDAVIEELARQQEVATHQTDYEVLLDLYTHLKKKQHRANKYFATGSRQLDRIEQEVRETKRRKDAALAFLQPQ